MAHIDPEKRKSYQRDLMRERRAGEKARSVKITLGELPAEEVLSEKEFHQKNLLVAARMQSLGLAALEAMKEITPRQALEFLDQAQKLRQSALVALATLDQKPEEEEGGFGTYGAQLKERLQDEHFMELSLAFLTYAPPTDAPQRKAPAKAKTVRKAPAKPKGSAAKKPEPGPNPKAPKGRPKT